jgi:hypothetical protein
MMFKPLMARLVAGMTAVAVLLILFAGVTAMAQSSGKTGSSGAGKQTQSFSGPPIGHRQPRADQFPSEKNLGDPNDPLNKENAALDRKLRSICRGC